MDKLIESTIELHSSIRENHIPFQETAEKWQYFDASQEIPDFTTGIPLTNEQENVVKYVLEASASKRAVRPEIVLLQAGPGRGKTFVLRRLLETFRLSRNVPLTVILKHNNLDRLRYTSRCKTTCLFFMQLLNINMTTFGALDRISSGIHTTDEYLWLYVRLLQVAVTRFVPLLGRSKLVVFDEYTVIPKLFLQLLLDCIDLMSSSVRDKIFIFSGDKNQLKYAPFCETYGARSNFDRDATPLIDLSDPASNRKLRLELYERVKALSSSWDDESLQRTVADNTENSAWDNVNVVDVVRTSLPTRYTKEIDAMVEWIEDNSRVSSEPIPDYLYLEDALSLAMFLIQNSLTESVRRLNFTNDENDIIALFRTRAIRDLP
ncbi:hypothetical protein QAD02_001462 [Eretmocerus hayati]|uniref:Uncharacterized protein n=1 Tax=Eretmocerus hayati TaxID=131215 RepID=A0ACC2NHB7_9HYME|nr:hypothetical protein QAD02_001462 [Eretmocerus hayati]